MGKVVKIDEARARHNRNLAYEEKFISTAKLPVNRLTVDGVEITRAVFEQMVRVGPSKGSDEPGNPFYPMVPVGWTTLTTPPESGFDVEYEGSLIIYDSAHLYRCSWGKWALDDLDYVGHVYIL